VFCRTVLLVCPLCFLIVSCSPKQPADLRLQILPLENLSPQSTQDWQGRLAPFILTSDLSGIPHLIADSRQPDPRANRVLQGYYDVHGDRMSLHATLEDPHRLKTLRVIVRQGPKSAGLLPLIDEVARDLNSGARTFPTRDPASLQSFSDALSAADPGVRLRLFQTATVQNPKFSSAFLALAETRLAQGDRAGAVEAAMQGKKVSTNATELAEFDYLASTARNDLAGREKAMRELVRQTPDDAQAIRTLAEIHALQRRFKEAAADYEAIARLEPDDPVTLNQLAYMDGYAHDLAGARAMIEKYRALVGPNDTNPTDTLGEIYFYNAEFAEAEKAFLQAGGGRELLKAAEAHLMTGDVGGADSLFDKYMGQQQHPREMERAEWEFLTGRRKQAMARAEKLMATPDDAGALAAAQLSLWRLQTGDRGSAAKLAEKASAQAVSPATKSLASVCRFLTQTPVRLSQFPNLNAMALILNQQFGDAIPVLEALLAETNPAKDAQVRTLLAWAYVETGNIEKAKPLVELYPLPLPSNEPVFVSLLFPRFLQVRAVALKENRTQELYDKLTAER
jgi:tetratricopeptide (TPR) repeat protein